MNLAFKTTELDQHAASDSVIRVFSDGMPIVDDAWLADSLFSMRRPSRAKFKLLDNIIVPRRNCAIDICEANTTNFIQLKSKPVVGTGNSQRRDSTKLRTNMRQQAENNLSLIDDKAWDMMQESLLLIAEPLDIELLSDPSMTEDSSSPSFFDCSDVGSVEDSAFPNPLAIPSTSMRHIETNRFVEELNRFLSSMPTTNNEFVSDQWLDWSSINPLPSHVIDSKIRTRLQPKTISQNRTLSAGERHNGDFHEGKQKIGEKCCVAEFQDPVVLKQSITRCLWNIETRGNHVLDKLVTSLAEDLVSDFWLPSQLMKRPNNMNKKQTSAQQFIQPRLRMGSSVTEKISILTSLGMSPNRVGAVTDVSCSASKSADLCVAKTTFTTWNYGNSDIQIMAEPHQTLTNKCTSKLNDDGNRCNTASYSRPRTKVNIAEKF